MSVIILGLNALLYLSVLFTSYLALAQEMANPAGGGTATVVSQSQPQYAAIHRCQLAIKKGYHIRNKPWRLCAEFMYSDLPEHRGVVFALFPDRVVTNSLATPRPNNVISSDPTEVIKSYALRYQSHHEEKWTNLAINMADHSISSCGGGTSDPEEVSTKKVTEISTDNSINIEELYADGLGKEISNIGEKFSKYNLLQSDKARAQLKNVFCECKDFQRLQGSLSALLTSLRDDVSSITDDPSRQTLETYLSELDACFAPLVS